MPRTAIALALILTLVTGLMTGLLAAQRSWSPAAIAPVDARVVEVAQEFYASINHVLRTGDALQLSALLSPDFVDHPAYREGDQPASAYIAYLESVRTTFPGLQLTSVPLSANGGMVAVDIEIAGQTAGSLAGVALDAGSSGRGYEVIRVEGDRVVERWGSRELPPLIESIVSAEMSLPLGSIPDARIERLTVEPNGFGAFVDRNGFILIGEIGTLRVRLEGLPEDRTILHTTPDADDSQRLVIGKTTQLTPGQSIVTPPGIGYRIANPSGTAATALMIAIRQGGPERGTPLPYEVIESSGIERALLAGTGIPEMQAGETRYSVVVARAALPPGARIPRHETSMAEMLVVTSGSLEALVHGGKVIWIKPGQSVASVEVQAIASNQGLYAGSQATVEYRAGGDSPASIWLVTIRAAGR